MSRADLENFFRAMLADIAGGDRGASEESRGEKVGEEWQLLAVSKAARSCARALHLAGLTPTSNLRSGLTFLKKDSDQ